MFERRPVYVPMFTGMRLAPIVERYAASVVSEQSVSSDARAAARNVIVALLALFVVGTSLPALSLAWDPEEASFGPQGPLGLSTDYDGVVKAVESGSSAWLAGIRDGDQIDLRRTAFDSRASVAANPARLPLGTSIETYIHRDAGSQPVRLVATKSGSNLVTLLNVIARTISTIIFVVVGGLLVVLRPSAMTWGFFLYCLGFGPGIALGSFSRFPSATSHTVYVLLTDVLSAAGTAGILAFALLFMSPQQARWRQVLERSVPFVFAAFVVLIVYPDVANLILGIPAETVQRLMLALQGVVFAVSVFAVVETYLHGKTQDRPRIQWVVVGLAVGVAGTYIGSALLFSSLLPFNPPRWLQSSLLILNVFLPVAVAYAVIRHRVLEVSFVVSRALIYGSLTFMILSMFAFIDWFVGRQLESVRLASYLSIAVAIGISFWLNTLEKRVETVVATVFFRKRRQAMLRLEHSAQAIHHASKMATVLDYLVREPVEALHLSSAAVFLPSDGAFKRVHAIAWADGTMSLIDSDDPLALELASERAPTRLADIGWHHSDLPVGLVAPILAVPLEARNDLLGLALYGAHTNGSDIDPEEVRALNDLADAAQATYDHLQVLELSQKVETLRTQIAALSAKPGEMTG